MLERVAMTHLAIDDIMKASPVIPVLTVEQGMDAVSMACAFLAGGLRVLEITLRTDAALDAIRRIARDVPDIVVGGGTVRTADDLWRLEEAGARFAVSPGLTPALVEAARARALPLLPGVATASEVMRANDAGFTRLKFFPAESSGGIRALKSFAAPFPDVAFCPTGGITSQSAPDYLALPNVLCIGGSWLMPPETDGDEEARWREVTRLASEAAAL